MLFGPMLAPEGMKGVADRAGGVIGGHVGFAMQAESKMSKSRVLM